MSTKPAAGQTLALMLAAGRLAQKLKIIPESWGSFSEVVLAVHQMVSTNPERQSALIRVKEYLKTHHHEIIEVEKLKAPLTLGDFENKAGALFSYKGRRCLLVSQRRFDTTFGSDRAAMMRELSGAGLVYSERGKMVIKPPRALCREGRVYWIDIDDPA